MLLGYIHLNHCATSFELIAFVQVWALIAVFKLGYDSGGRLNIMYNLNLYLFTERSSNVIHIFSIKLAKRGRQFVKVLLKNTSKTTLI